MNDDRRPRSSLDDDKHVVELTSGQLVFAISVLLLIALGCFLLGMIVDRFQRPDQTMNLARPPSQTASPMGTVEPSTTDDEKKGEGTQVSPRRDIVAPSRAAATVPSGTPRVVELPAPEKNPTATIPAPATLAKPTPAPGSTPVSAPDKTPAPSGPSESAPTAVAAAPQTSESAKPAVTTEPEKSASEDARYGVQVVAYDMKDRAKAEEYKRRVESNSDLKVELISSPDGKLIRGFIGVFPERQSAEKARDVLKKRAGFADCFVKALREN